MFRRAWMEEGVPSGEDGDESPVCVVCPYFEPLGRNARTLHTRRLDET